MKGDKSMVSKAQARAVDKYQKANIRRFVLKLNKKTDADLIAHLENCENVQGEIKRILREYIKEK